MLLAGKNQEERKKSAWVKIAQKNAQREAGKNILRHIGAGLKAARVHCDFSQEAVGSMRNWNRDAISKLERGALDIKLVGYLEIVRLIGDGLPAGHPAVALAKRYRSA